MRSIRTFLNYFPILAYRCVFVAGDYVLPKSCPPIDRWRLFKDFLLWSLPTIPCCMLMFVACRYAHMRLGRPVPYRRHVDDQGDRVDTCELYTELEAVDPKENTRADVQEARLRVHPSSRRRHHGKHEEEDAPRSAVENARTVMPRIDKKKNRGTTRHKGVKDVKTTTEDEDITQHSIVESLSKTQSLSPVSSEFYRSTQPSSVLPPDSAGSTPRVDDGISDVIPADVPPLGTSAQRHAQSESFIPPLLQFGHYGYQPLQTNVSHQQQQQKNYYHENERYIPNYYSRLNSHPSTIRLTDANRHLPIPEQHLINFPLHRGDTGTTRGASRRKRGHDFSRK